MLSTTLIEGLARYQIGQTLRSLRLRRKLGLVELGRHTGLSPALLSKIERGRLVPTLPTLLRIALVFGVGLEYFFAGARERPVVAVVRKNDRRRFPGRPGHGDVAFHFECLDYPATERKMNAYYAEFDATSPETTLTHEHAGAEVIYVLRGQLAVAFDNEEHVLGEGDSMYFDAGRSHGYRRHGAAPCAAIVVTAT